MLAALKHRAAVILKNGQPIADVIGMAHGGLDAVLGAKERAGQFGDQFFAGIAFRAEAVCQVARQPRGMAGPVAEFMKTGAVIIDLVEEGGLRRERE